MKNIIIALFISNCYFSQVAIEKTTVDGSGILDFPLLTTKGIILPNVTNSSLMTPVTRGTLVYDNTTKNAQYYDGAWKTLNILSAADNASTPLPGSDLPNTKVGVIIGKQSTTAEGVLVLESDTKALILPKVESPVANIKSPVAGTMVYDPTKKIMAIYNGKDWSFWK